MNKLLVIPLFVTSVFVSASNNMSPEERAMEVLQHTIATGSHAPYSNAAFDEVLSHKQGQAWSPIFDHSPTTGQMIMGFIGGTLLIAGKGVAAGAFNYLTKSAGQQVGQEVEKKIVQTTIVKVEEVKAEKKPVLETDEKKALDALNNLSLTQLHFLSESERTLHPEKTYFQEKYKNAMSPKH